MLYAGWGKIFGYDLAVLRIFSLLISAITFLLFAWLLLQHVQNPGLAFGALSILFLNPYTVGLSMFIYTDMLMMLCLMAFLVAVERESRVLLFVSAASGLLVRQYFVFVVLAGVVYYIMRGQLSRNRSSYTSALIIGLACIPLGFLVSMWKGPAPPAGISLWIHAQATLFHPASITLSVAILFLFASPLVLYNWRQFIFPPIQHILLAACSLLYFLFPVGTSESTAWSGRQTVGLFHWTLANVFSSEIVVHVTFYICFLAGLHVLALFAKDFLALIRSRDASFRMLLCLIVGSFLIVMPFSYQIWEKYSLPLVPVELLILTM